MFKSLLTPAYTPGDTRHRAGTFPNLFCSHPPFQMDGNWGGASGIGEMLVQSHEGFINLLPALPDALVEGSLRGFKTRGGATIDRMEWSGGHVKRLALVGGPQENIRILTPPETGSILINGISVKPDRFIDLKLKEGETAEILFK